MRVVALYHQNSEQSGPVEDYIREFHMRHPEHAIEPISLETPGGADMARLYGVVRYPAVLALASDGKLLQLWQDEHLPLMNEIDFYMDY